MIKPHDYQEEIINKAFDKLNNISSLCIQANTGAGKTVIMAFICKRWIEEKRGGVVITCHRKELVDQTVSTLLAVGLSAQSFTASSKNKHQFVDVHVAMIETLNKRLEKGKFDTTGVTLVISDEAHIQVHSKVYDYFQEAKVIGFTATPVLLKRVTYYKCKYCKNEYQEITDCCGEEIEEWTKPFAMSNIYEDIIVGPNFQKLQEVGQLVPEISYVKNYADSSTLKIDSTGEYTQKSLTDTYGNEESLFNVILNYEELCRGKRTMVFNPSTKVNALVYEKFKEKGYNVKMYDSVNISDVSRTQLVEWFNSNDDAILCNCGVFTTGFDSREVQAIIMNRSTKSLSLWLQIAGRGGRSSIKIYKQDFIIIDGGDNIAEFGEWSSDRDWEDIFWNGIGKERPKKVDVEDVQDCPNCGALYPKNESSCTICGHKIEPTEKSIEKSDKIEESKDVLVSIRDIPPPNAKKIEEYTRRCNEGFNFALKILYRRVVDMFIYYRVSKNQYLSNLKDGRLEVRVRKMIYPCYFHFINSGLEGSNRTLENVVSRCLDKIKIHYEGRS